MASDKLREEAERAAKEVYMMGCACSHGLCNAHARIARSIVAVAEAHSKGVVEAWTESTREIGRLVEASRPIVADNDSLRARVAELEAEVARLVQPDKHHHVCALLDTLRLRCREVAGELKTQYPMNLSDNFCRWAEALATRLEAAAGGAEPCTHPPSHFCVKCESDDDDPGARPLKFPSKEAFLRAMRGEVKCGDEHTGAFCSLPAGHDGWHKCDGEHGSTYTWPWLTPEQMIIEDRIKLLKQERDDAWALAAVLKKNIVRRRQVSRSLRQRLSAKAAEAERLRAELAESLALNEMWRKRYTIKIATPSGEQEVIGDPRCERFDVVGKLPLPGEGTMQRELAKLRDLICELEIVHLRADVLEKRLFVVGDGFAEMPAAEREKTEASLESELAMLAARRLHLLTICGVKDRVTAGEACSIEENNP